MRNSQRMAGVLVGWVLLLGAGAVSAQDWPQWRGPGRDNKVTGFIVPKEWPKELTQKWKATVGDGDASPVLVGDKVYVFARQGGDEVLTCLDAEKGKELWSDKYAAAPATVPMGGHKGPRCTPVVADGKVCTLGVGGVLSCLEADSGKLLWRKETKANPRFFTASSPLVFEGKCVAFLGGNKGDLGAFDLGNGEAKWEWTGEAPAYGSPVLMTVEKTQQVVTLTDSSLVGVGAADGKLLWKVAYKSRYNSNTPIVDGQTVICSAPETGTVAYKVEKTDDGFAAKELWKKSTAAGMYNTPVLKDGALYGLASAGRGSTNIFCMNAENGETLWTDKKPRGECGAILDAGDVLLALTSDKELVVFKPDKKEYSELTRYNKVSDTPTWAYPIVAGNRVFVKGADTLILWTIE
jgi:outer membrane protein assembly factor BamB